MKLLDEHERAEAVRLAAELHAYADDVITRQVDADDLKDAAESALNRGDIDTLRVYSKCISNSFFDVFVTDSHIRTLRKHGYTNLASFYTDRTDQIAHEVLSSLLESSENSHQRLSADIYDRVPAYAMANPDLVPLILSFISSRRATNYDEVVALVEQSRMSPAVSGGAL